MLGTGAARRAPPTISSLLPELAFNPHTFSRRSLAFAVGAEGLLARQALTE
jgi:hypothetical protein